MCVGKTFFPPTLITCKLPWTWRCMKSDGHGDRRDRDDVEALHKEKERGKIRKAQRDMRKRYEHYVQCLGLD